MRELSLRRKAPPVPWSDPDRARLERIWTDGQPDIIRRAEEAFPTRTRAAIISMAQHMALCRPERRGRGAKRRPGQRTTPAAQVCVVDVSQRHSRVPSRDRLPDFLRSDFRRWGVPC